NGKPNLSPTAFLVDYCNRVYVSGWGVFSITSTLNPGQHLYPLTNMDVSPDAYDNSCSTGDFYMAVFDEDMTTMEYATFFGGGQSSEHVDGGTSRFDRKGVIYQSVCAGCGSNDDFPIFPSDAVSPTNNSTNCNNGVYKFDFQLPLTVADFLVPPVACVNVPLLFQNTSTYNATNQWNFDDGGTSSLASPTHFFELPGVYDVMLIVTHPGTCNGIDTVIKQIEIILPSTTYLDDVSLCFNSTEELGPDEVDPGAEYQWTPSSYLDDDQSPNPLFTPGDDTDYVLLIEHAGCVDTMYQSVLVTSFEFSIPEDTTLCESGLLELTATVSDNDVEMIWSDQPDFSNVLNDNTGDEDIQVDVQTPLTLYFSASLDGCTATDEVVVNLVSFQTNIQGDFTACEGDTVELSIEDPNALFVYHWTPEELILTGQNSPVVTVVVNETTEFFVESETPYNCSAIDSVTVTVSELTS
ncbi:MAG: PKD domain-containing protein, partial [Flavobacteriales bacterium]|nr:PKD domain-containing protein [Flavobacteriales bacterium]